MPERLMQLLLIWPNCGIAVGLSMELADDFMAKEAWGLLGLFHALLTSLWRLPAACCLQATPLGSA
jgi:hypothetical protein